MKKLLICCLAICLAMVPVSTAKAASNTTTMVISDSFSFSMEIDKDLSERIINSEDSFTISPDGNSMTTTITMNYEGEVVPARSIEVTKTYGTSVYRGTVYLKTFRYLDGVTSATYEGTLYLVSDTSTS